MASATRVQLSIEGAPGSGALERGGHNAHLDFITQVGVAHPCANPHMNCKCFSDKLYACLEKAI